MSRFIAEADRSQGTLLPESIDEYVSEDNPVRVIEAFVDALDLAGLGFAGVEPKATGRPAYHPATMLKIYLYGYLNRIQSTRRLEQEARRNLELMWLVGRLAPDFKTLADFRAGNTAAIKNVCRDRASTNRASRQGRATRPVALPDRPRRAAPIPAPPGSSRPGGAHRRRGPPT